MRGDHIKVLANWEVGEPSPKSIWALLLSMGLTQIPGGSGSSIPQQTSSWVFSWFLKQTKQSLHVLFKRAPKGKENQLYEQSTFFFLPK